MTLHSEIKSRSIDLQELRRLHDVPGGLLQGPLYQSTFGRCDNFVVCFFVLQIIFHHCQNNNMTEIAQASESEIETLILDWLNLQPGCFAFKVETSGWYDSVKQIYRKRRSKYVLRGTSDIIGCYRGRFFAMEVKSEKGRPSPEQDWFLSIVKQKHGYGGVVRSIEDAEKILGEIRLWLSSGYG